MNDLKGYSVRPIDGDDVGKVHDMMFDNQQWTVRYFVIDTGGVFRRHRVLVSPQAIGRATADGRVLEVNLSRQQLENSPEFDPDQPITREYERKYFDYYGYPYYWGPTTAGREGGAVVPRGEADAGARHLRTLRELAGYGIHALDGDLGKVDDFIGDDDTWQVRYLVVDTAKFWFGHKVLVSPAWLTEIDWDDHKVHLDLSKETIKESPEWDPSQPVNREYEVRLYDYYGRPVYWSGERVGPAPHATQPGAP